MNYVLIFALMLTTMTSCEKSTVLDEGKCPAEIKTYVEHHFPGKKMLQCIKDVDGLDVDYEVVLEGNYRLEFNKSKEIDNIKGLEKLPDSVIPPVVLDYVKTNYPNNIILEWDLDKNIQEIKLDNRIELVFDLLGNFLRIDD
ncbi:MAG: PepSY-like domain-containing protein [Saprospiraceae bacterium]|nr:PepSY-like domain-containing protein [Saprospiraceae bacterium]